MNSRWFGIACAIISAMIFGGLPIMTKSLFDAGATLVGLAFYRYCCVSIILLIFGLVTHKSFKIERGLWLRIIACGVIGISSTALLLYVAYTLIPTGMVTTLHFTYPIMVSLVSVVLLGKKSHKLKYLALLIAALGIFMLFDLNGKINSFGILITLLSAVTYTIYIVLMDDEKISAEIPLVIAFYVNLVCVVTTGLVGIATQQLTISLSPNGWGLLFLTAVAIGIGGTVFFQIAVRNIGGQSASILSTFEPITSIIIGVLLLGEMLNIKTIAGIILILISSTIVIVTENGKVMS